MDDQYPIQQEQWEEIERFLQQKMSPEEEAVFRVRMESDAQLKKATEEIMMLTIGIQQSSLQQKLDSYHDELNTAAPPKKVVSMKQWLVAASIALITITAAYLVFNKQDKTLYGEFFQADPGLVSAMGGTSDYQFDRGMIDYKTGNYASAIKQWQPLLDSKANSDTLNYFLASAYLANNEPVKAIPFFEKVIAADSSVFKEDAYWYLALAHIKQEKTKEAIPYLERSAHPQKENLLKKLND